MITKQFSDAIKIVADRMKENSIVWAVIGSGALALQGMDVNPNDLDISANVNDLEKVREIFSDHASTEVKKIETLSGKEAWDVMSNINGTETQFCGETNNDAEAIWFNRVASGLINHIDIGGISVPCISLEASIDAYEELHRPQKVELIREFLKR